MIVYFGVGLFTLSPTRKRLVCVPYTSVGILAKNSRYKTLDHLHKFRIADDLAHCDEIHESRQV